LGIKLPLSQADVSCQLLTGRSFNHQDQIGEIFIMAFKLSSLVLLFILFQLTAGLCQEKPEKPEKPVYGWQNEVIGGFNLTQASFDNWSQGGDNTLAWQLNLSAKFNKDMEKYNWSNNGKVAFGKTKLGKQESRKSIDEIRLETVYSYKLNLYVNPYISAYGETQLAKGYTYTDTSKVLISNFFDPGYLIESVGLSYSHSKYVKTRLGAAIKETFANEFAPLYSDDSDTPDKIEKVKVEPGAESVTDLTVNLAKDIQFTSRLELFSNIKAFIETDVRWDNVLTAKVTQYVDVNFNIKLFYDRDISYKRQLKQALSLGLSYTFL